MAAPPFRGNWGSALWRTLAIVYCVSCIVHLASLVLVPALLIVPGALAWSLYARWLRPHTSPGFDEQFFKMATYGFWYVPILVEIATHVFFAPQILLNIVEPLNEPHPVDALGGLSVLQASVLKYSIVEAAILFYVRIPMRCSARRAGQDAYSTLALLIATSLGLSISYSVFHLLGSYISAAGGHQSVVAGGAALATVIRDLTSAPIDTLCAAVTGLRIAVRSVQQANQVALLVHAPASSVDSRQQQLPLDLNVPPAASTLSQPKQPQQQRVDNEVTLELAPSLWSWPRVLWPAITIKAVYNVLGYVVHGDGGAITVGRAALSLMFHAALLLGSYVIVNQQFLQQWLPLVAGREPVPVSPLATFLQLVRSTPRDVLWPFWWRPEFAAAAVQEARCEECSGSGTTT